MMTTAIAHLGEIAEIDSGSGFPLQHQGNSDREYPFLKVSDMNLPGNEKRIVAWRNSVDNQTRHLLRAKSFRAGTIIFPKVGAAIATNKKRILTRPSCIDNNCMGVSGRPEIVEDEYLYYALLHKDLSDFASHSNPPSIRKAEVESWRLPLPNIKGQKGAADVLSRAEGIIRLRREAQKKAAEFLPALFVAMFGDPVFNPKGHPILTLGRMADVVSGITKGRKLNGQTTTPVPYLRVANVQAGFLNLAEMKEIAATPAEIDDLCLRSGDVVLTEGGDFDKLGRGAQWRGEIARCIHQNHVFRVRLHGNVALPDYFEAYLQTHAAVRYFLSVAKRTTNLASINMTQLRSLPVMVPPLHDQRQFANSVEQVRAIQLQQRAATLNAETAFDALLARFFSDQYGGAEEEAQRVLEGAA